MFFPLSELSAWRAGSILILWLWIQNISHGNVLIIYVHQYSKYLLYKTSTWLLDAPTHFRSNLATASHHKLWTATTAVYLFLYYIIYSEHKTYPMATWMLIICIEWIIFVTQIYKMDAPRTKSFSFKWMFVLSCDLHVTA